MKLESGLKEGPDDEAIEVHGRADHWVLREQEQGFRPPSLPQARDQHGDVLRLEAKFGGMDVSEARRLKQLEDENAKLKRLLADAMLDNVALKDLLEKNSDACRQARGSRSFCSCLRDERAPGVPPDPG